MVAKQTVLVSDLSGEPIPSGEAATVTVKFGDARRGVVTLDARVDEVQELASKGRRTERRGRRPAQQSQDQQPQ